MTYFSSSVSSIPAEWAFKEGSLNFRRCICDMEVVTDLVGVLSEAGNKKLHSTTKSHSRFYYVWKGDKFCAT